MKRVNRVKNDNIILLRTHRARGGKNKSSRFSLSAAILRCVPDGEVMKSAGGLRGGLNETAGLAERACGVHRLSVLVSCTILSTVSKPFLSCIVEFTYQINYDTYT